MDLEKFIQVYNIIDNYEYKNNILDRIRIANPKF